MQGLDRATDPPHTSAPRNQWGHGVVNKAMTRVTDTVLDFTVLALAAWTVIYHVCLIARIPVNPAIALGFTVLPGCVWLAFRNTRVSRTLPASLATPATNPATSLASLEARDTPAPGTRPSRQAWHVVLPTIAVASAIAAAIRFGMSTEPWWWTWVLWITAALAGTAHGFLFRNRRLEPNDDKVDAGDTLLGTSTAMFCAVALGIFALFFQRRNGDDAFYLNQAAWVAERGTFPLRDTLFANLEFPAIFWPPVASYEALIGATSRFLGLPSLDVAYLIIPATATFLATLALWRLLRAWRVGAPAVALMIALLYLLWSGADSQSYGNFFLGRIWQGKALFLSLMVPLLLTHVQQYARQPTRTRLALLVAGGVASVGLTTNGMFLAPLVALAGTAPLLFGRPLVALKGFIGMAIYPLGAAVATLTLGGYTPDNYASLLDHTVPSWLTHHVLMDGVRAGVTLFVVLVAALLARQGEAKIVLGAATVVAGIVYAPGMPRFIFTITGLGQTLWRVMWILPAAALLGAFGVVTVSALRNSRYALAGYVLPVALATTLIITGTPLWSAQNAGAAIEAAPGWKRPPDSLVVARTILRHTQPGDTVLVRSRIAVTVAVMTTLVKTVAVRKYYMGPAKHIPEFHHDQRLLVKDFIEGSLNAARWDKIPEYLRLLGVDVACTGPTHPHVAELLMEHGYEPLPPTPMVRCYGYTGPDRAAPPPEPQRERPATRHDRTARQRHHQGKHHQGQGHRGQHREKARDGGQTRHRHKSRDGQAEVKSPEATRR